MIEQSESELSYPLFENDFKGEETIQAISSDKKDKPKPYKMKLAWRNIILMLILHGLAIYTFLISPYIMTKTTIFSFLMGVLGSFGVQAGAHRLWSHRSYKANVGLRLVLSLLHVLALQNDLYEWCRDHRAHHRWSETDADPHNSSRGFFFSHVGWLLVKKHPEVKRKGATLDLSDLEADPIVMFQRKFYIPLALLIWGIIPTIIPFYFWNESLLYSFLSAVVLRYIYNLNLTWLVNSWAHIYGSRPYNKNIAPVEASIRHLLNGEGFHNYHHTFPWDYSASELGPGDVFNPVTGLINFFAWMGWAWDLKKANPELVKKINKTYGDDQYEKRNAAYEWTKGIIICYGHFFVIDIFYNLLYNSFLYQFF